MFVKDKAEISSRVEGYVRSCVFWQVGLGFESDKHEFNLGGVKSKKISSHPGRDLLKSVLKVRNDSLTITCFLWRHLGLVAWNA